MYSDPADWWRQQDCSSNLKQLAIYSLSINPTMGAAERNWSVHGFIHSKTRNRLTNPRVQKLVYLFQNLRVRDEIKTANAAYFDDSEVEDASDNEYDTSDDTAEMAVVLASDDPDYGVQGSPDRV